MGSYVFLAGARASTVRAGIMGMFILIAWQAVGKTPDILFVWAFAVIALIAFSGGAVLNLAKAVGVTGTPTLFINGKRMSGRSFDDFKNAIEEYTKKK